MLPDTPDEGDVMIHAECGAWLRMENNALVVYSPTAEDIYTVHQYAVKRRQRSGRN
jgi:prepilin signal peptidase PulO-like enzyme (type II secretory pathway)